MKIGRAAKIIPLLAESARNRLFRSGPIFYVTESHDWVIRKIGASLSRYFLPDYQITSAHYGIRRSIVHYGSINTFLARNGIRSAHKSNRSVVTWFHLSPGDGRYGMIPGAIERVELWHTACALTKERLMNLGIPEQKIVVIPLGIELQYYHPPDENERRHVRSKLGIPEDAVVVGSFQKDGNGWGEGLEPKLIKGPDIFCDAVVALSGKYRIHVLLTGPARGYVKKRLSEAGIPFVHHMLKGDHEIAQYYRALDLYLVASRVEGGPLSFLEAMATGIPLVTTNVGMADDIIQEGLNGFIARTEGHAVVDELVALAERALSCDIGEYRKSARRISFAYDWENIAELYRQRLYVPLLQEGPTSVS